MELAKFSFKGFRITEAELHFDNATNNLKLQFYPEGVFDAEKSQYHLHISFRALNDNKNEDLVVRTECVALFQLEQTVKGLENVPQFFYANSIAIVYPYLRAFMSTLTIQANISPIVLPTLNLSSLENDLRKNTVLK